MRLKTLLLLSALLAMPFACAGQDAAPSADPLLDVLKSTIVDEASIEARLQEAAKLLEARAKSPTLRPAATNPSRGPVGGAQVSGPTEAALGDLVVLDASGSGADAYAWVLASHDKTYLAFENNTKVVFATGTPGVYVFVLSVASVNLDGEVSLASVKHSLTVGRPPVDPGPGPTPPPPPPPPPLSAFSVQVRDAARAASDPATAAELAGNFERVRTDIIGGSVYTGALADARKKIIADTFALNNPIKTRQPAWAPFFDVHLRGWLNARDAAGQLTTLEGIAEVYREIAAGLREASR